MIQYVSKYTLSSSRSSIDESYIVTNSTYSSSSKYNIFNLD